MQFTEHRPTDGVAIRSAGPGEVIIGEERYTASICVEGDQITPWGIDTIGDLAVSDAKALAKSAPELVVVGSGRLCRFPNPDFQHALFAAGIGCEVMATDAACRTYNVLASEGRRVLAALIID